MNQRLYIKKEEMVTIQIPKRVFDIPDFRGALQKIFQIYDKHLEYSISDMMLKIKNENKLKQEFL